MAFAADAGGTDGAGDLTPLYGPDRPLPEALRGGAIAIGNFDGVHRGHHAVLTACRSAGLPIGVLTFEPHPRAVLKPGEPPFRLALLPAKRRRLKAAGVDFVYALPFDRALAATSAEAFIDTVLLGQLAPRHVAVGADFCFGHQRKGTAALLRNRLAPHGVRVDAVAKLVDADGEAVSSSAIRAHLQAGRPEAAAALLGVPWEIEGEVEPGDRRGRLLGFPTANIALREHLRPSFGVYAVRVGPVATAAGGDGLVPGVANIGVRPTVDGSAPRLEAHLFDFDGDLYGRQLRVQLIAHLRPEQRFDGLEALKAQIARDADAARVILRAGKPAAAG